VYTEQGIEGKRMMGGVGEGRVLSAEFMREGVVGGR
jgi:hypothetical protein